METVVFRTVDKGRFRYQMNGAPWLLGQSNWTYGVGLRSMAVCDQAGSRLYALRQTNWPLKLLHWALLSWWLPIGQLPKYKFYVGEACQGGTAYSFLTAKRHLYLEDGLYELYLHADNYVSILKNQAQVALLQKSAVTMAERNQYFLSYHPQLEQDLGRLLLLAMFCDLIYFPNRSQLHYYKYEKTLGPDLFPERRSWRPPAL